ncbi:MAG: Clp protease N-terminal domain-containing protein, partial [Aggregatilineales bacterium]
MDLNRYTHKAREALLKAQSLASEYKNPAIEPIHILVGLLTQKDGVVPEIVAKIDGQSSALLDGAQSLLRAQPRHFGAAHMLGVLLYQRRQYREAHGWLVKALQIEPRDPAAHTNL